MIKAQHKNHHLRVEISLELARILDNSIKQREMEECAKHCIQCQWINPGPTLYQSGELCVDEKWVRFSFIFDPV